MRATRPCPICGFINTKEAQRCLKCSAGLTGGDVADLLGRKSGLDSRLRDLVSRMLAPLRRRAEKAREDLSPDVMPGLDYRSPWVAAWLALLPGGGCLYNRRPRRALVFGAVYLTIVAICLVTLKWKHNNWLLGVWALWMLFSFNDSLVIAIRRNGQFWTPRHSLAAYSFLLFAVSVLSLAGQFFLSPVFTLAIISQNVLKPTLDKGDRVFVWKPVYWFGSPQRGDIVFYDPPRYTITDYRDPTTASRTMRDMNREYVHKMEIWNESESAVYSVNESRAFERVNGVGGDAIDRTAGGPVLLNGRPMPEAWLPLVPEGLPNDFHFVVPPGKYCVLISHFSEDTMMQMGVSFGGTAPYPGAPGMQLQGWQEACIVGDEEIMGLTTAIYHPPERRRWLTPESP